MLGWINSTKLTCDTPKQVRSKHIVSPVFNLLNAPFIGTVLFRAFKKQEKQILWPSLFTVCLFALRWFKIRWPFSSGEKNVFLHLSDSNIRTSTIQQPLRASLIKQFPEMIGLLEENILWFFLRCPLPDASSVSYIDNEEVPSQPGSSQLGASQLGFIQRCWRPKSPSQLSAVGANSTLLSLSWGL